MATPGVLGVHGRFARNRSGAPQMARRTRRKPGAFGYHTILQGSSLDVPRSQRTPMGNPEL